MFFFFFFGGGGGGFSCFFFFGGGGVFENFCYVDGSIYMPLRMFKYMVHADGQRYVHAVSVVRFI